MSFDTICIADYHLVDINPNKNYNKWLNQMFTHTFENISKIIKKHKVKKVMLIGDLFDAPPKQQSLALFDKFISYIKPYNLEIIMISGNHEILPSTERLYYQDVMKDFFWNNYQIVVKEFEENEAGNILYCSHKHIKKLENLDKKYKIVYSHFRSLIDPIPDEINLASLYRNAELSVNGDIHFRASNRNIVYTSSPIDTHFSSTNLEEANTPSVLLLNEETLEWKWETVLQDKFRKKKRTYSSVREFWENVDAIKEDWETNKNFYKIVVQDNKINLNAVEVSLYSKFAIIDKARTDLAYKTITNIEQVNALLDNLGKKSISANLLEYCEQNLTQPRLLDLLRKVYTRYEQKSKEELISQSLFKGDIE